MTNDHPTVLGAPVAGSSLRYDRQMTNDKITNWIPFGEGEYLVEKAFLFAPDDSAVLLEDAVIEISEDSRGHRRMMGDGRIQTILLVELMDDHDDIALALDLGDEFKYIMKDPILKGGKVFSPNVKASLQFSPDEPWRHIPEEEFEALWKRLKVLGT